ncbi:MAG: hypothetical protein RLZZ230_495 [Candidatus Parcubacteria bacterium]
MSKIYILLVTLLVIIIGGLYYYGFYGKGENVVLNETESSVPKEPEVIINNSQESLKKYENTTFGFSFEYPVDWHIGNDNLGKGTLQLFNYDESLVSGSVLKSGRNKIEIVISGTNIDDSTDIYTDLLQEEYEIEVAGVTSKKFIIELTGGEKMITYYIPLTKTKEEYLSMTMYGDINNFRVIDNIAGSLMWLK